MKHLLDYLQSLGLIIAITVMGSLLRHSIAPTNIAMLYILVVVITALRWGRGPSLFAAITSVLMLDFFFVPPKFSMTVADTQYLIAFVTLFIVGIVISSLALKERAQAEAAKNREMHALSLYNLSQDLVKSINIERVFQIVLNHVSATFNAETAVVMKDGGNLPVKMKSHDFIQNEADRRAVIWAFENGIPAGFNTLNIPEANAHYIPLRTTRENFGVLGVLFKNRRKTLGTEQQRLLETFANQISFAVERIKLLEEVQHAELLKQTEKLHTAFLNSVSHDLRTPLATISGALSSAMHDRHINKENYRALIATAYDEAIRLNQLVGDLLDMAKIEAGALYLHKKSADVRDLIGTTLKQMKKTLKDHAVTIDIPESVPEIEIDFVFMMKVLTNIFDNAVKYSLAKKEIDIVVAVIQDTVEIKISDRGIGIPESDIKYIFDKFYRIKRPQTYEGTGLGLSVCKGIVDAHNGKIWVANRQGGGSVITIALPLPQK
jgi:two-component system sensor histidine kinase KdpD